MIKAIFFDIDGTLVNKHSKAHPTTRQAIKAAQAQGILCGIATGRSPVKLERLIDYLDMDMFVTYNGQLVFTKEQELAGQPFTPAVLAEIVTFADTNHRQIIFGSRDQLAGSNTMRWGNSVLAKRLSQLLPKRFSISFLKKLLQKWSPNRRQTRYRQLAILQQPIYQCILFSPESEHETLQQLLPNCSFQRSNPYSVDITPKGGSKINGIKAFIKHWDIELAEVMAFGDHYNDLEMLEAVGIGVAMGNAQEKVKAAADFVTLTNEEAGIAYALQHFGVIKEEDYEKNQ